MKVHNPYGSKERLLEMFQRVNKLKLDETFDIPVVDDKAYLDKTGDKPAEEEQPNKYDGGVDYPAIDDLKTDHEALDKIAEDENMDEISLAGLKGAGNYVKDRVGDRLQKGYDAVNRGVQKATDTAKEKVGNVKKAYHRSAGDSQLGKIEKYATNFGEKFGKYIAKYNEQAQKAGLEPINVNSVKMVIAQSLEQAAKQGNASFDMSRYKMNEDGEYQEIEGGIADEADPNEFLPDQILKGIEVEMEHTDDPRQALEIAMDHLAEIPDYYDHLNDMEDEAGVEDETDHSADALLDPSQHWIDDYSPKKLGDEAAIDENNTDVSPQLQKWLEFHKMSADEYRRLPYQEKVNLINQYQKVHPPQQSQEPQGDLEGIANWLAKDKAAGRSPMDEDNATTLKFGHDQRGNYLPQGKEDAGVGIRQVEQPMGSGNVKYLVVQLGQNGDVEEVIDTKDSFEEASNVVYDVIM